MTIEEQLKIAPSTNAANKQSELYWKPSIITLSSAEDLSIGAGTE